MKYLLITTFSFFFFLGQAQKINPLNVELNYYLPDIEYNSNITTPESFLGHQVGEWHVSHDKLVAYMEVLAEESSRIQIETYAHSHENRPLVLLTISSEDNLKNIDKIHKDHVALTDAKVSNSLDTENMPIVVYQGYSVHGNESSGANAAVLIAYYLAAGQGDKVNELLENAVILLDPCYNPDGLHRFSSWANSHKSNSLVSDPSDREYNEVWPGGRTNHYWFDLNRDWLLLTHPESRGRIENFQKWKPNILTDHHEMGTNSTFFFQPGVPERTNPNTPQMNQDLTEKIGLYHAKALDKIGSMYYTKESFDDFYYGKGSTYPDIQGSIGILFEQASSRGHYQESVNGILTFPFTIRNQVVTSISTQDAAIGLRKEILDFQRKFYLDAADEARKSSIKAYKIPKANDYNKAAYFAEVMMQHDIKVYDDQKNDGYFYIPAEQKQSKLIHIIFEEVKKFKVNIFYDVSAWTFPYAFDLDVQNDTKWNVSDKNLLTEYPQKEIHFPEDSKKYVSYAIDWSDWKAGVLVGRMLDKGIKAITIHEAFEGASSVGKRSFERGTVIFPNKSEEVGSTLKKEASDLGIDVYGLETGFNSEGVMLGSPSSYHLNKVSALMIIGDGINGYDAGEIWYQMDQRLELPLTKVEAYKFDRLNLDRYNVIILPDGRYSYLSERGQKNLEKWVRDGGTLIAFKRAINHLKKIKFIDFESVASTKTNYPGEEYGTSQEKSAKHVIGGAIFKTKIDTSYPLFYGYQDSDLPTFKRGTLAIKANSDLLSNPMIYTSQPLASGYASDENIERIKDSAGLIAYSMGRGKIICSVDNPLFRGYWIGGNKMFENMLYLSGSIRRNGTQD